MMLVRLAGALTLERDQVRPVRPDDIPHTRELASA